MKHTNTSPHQSSAIGKTALVILMVGIIALFAALGVTFLKTPTPPEQVSIPVPSLFVLNTLILAIVSGLLHSAWKTYPQVLSRKKMSLAMVFAVAFLLSQSYAWYMLSGLLDLEYPNLKIQYLYLLSSVHAVHILGGLAFLLFVMLKYDQLKGQRYLELSVYFWHFLGILWVYLLAVLWIGL